MQAGGSEHGFASDPSLRVLQVNSGLQGPELPVEHLSSAQEKSPSFPHLPVPEEPVKPAETFIEVSFLILKTSTMLNMLFR